MEFIKKIPLPLAGLMLALATLGNLLEAYGSFYRMFFGLLALTAFVLITANLVIYPKSVLEGFQNPLLAGVMPTFPMGMIILATYFRPYIPAAAFGIWIGGLILHAVLILYFTKKFIFNFNIKKVFPTYFIVYVGIVAGSVTAPAFNLIALGQVLFWFGFSANLILLPIVLYRLFKIKEMPEPALPTIIIFAAPTSLCLAGYLNTFPEKNMLIVGFLTSLAVVMLVFALVYMPRLLKLNFYPSYAAFTFPIVISAVAVKSSGAFFAGTGRAVPALVSLGHFLEYFAVLMVLYVTVRYVMFFIYGVTATAIVAGVSSDHGSPAKLP